MKVKSICLVTEGYPAKGDPYFPFVELLCKEFARQGIQVTVICPQSILSCIKHLEKPHPWKRVDIVDMLRGAYPLPIDFKELVMIGKTLDLDNGDIYNIWEERMKQVLETNGMNIQNNIALLNSMFECAKKYIDN